MKSKQLHLTRACSLHALIPIFILLAITFSTTAVSAQSAVEAEVTVSITVDAYATQGWKSVEDFTALIAAERIVAAQQLAAPNLSDGQIALYTGYDRLLEYMQADIAVKAPVESIAENNFKKVMQEAPADPVLVHLQQNEFTNLYGSLVAKLVNK